MGRYVNYREYIRSTAWAKKKQEKYTQIRLKYGRFTCEECGTTTFSDPPHCHHLTYRDWCGNSILGREDVKEHLRLLCHDCHAEHHPKHQPKKMADIERELDAMFGTNFTISKT